MNEKYIIADNKLENVTVDGRIIGCQVGLRIPYYMGVPLSQIEHIVLKIDGVEVLQEDMRIITEDGEEFKMSEIITCYRHFWEYGAKLQVRVLKEGGLSKGKHRIDVDVAVDVIYAPKGFGSIAYAEFTI